MSDTAKRGFKMSGSLGLAALMLPEHRQYLFI